MDSNVSCGELQPKVNAEYILHREKVNAKADQIIQSLEGYTLKEVQDICNEIGQRAYHLSHNVPLKF